MGGKWDFSRRLIWACMRSKYENIIEEGKIDLETKKILFLGDAGVGKTSMQLYFREKGFLKHYNKTQGNERHYVETAAVTETWEDVKDPENEQQYAASYAAVTMTDDSTSETVEHFKLLFALLCVCLPFAFFPSGLCSLKIIGCLFCTLFFSDNLPMGIRYGEDVALRVFYRYACMEMLYADSNMQHRINSPDLLLEFHLRVLCCALLVGFVLGFGCRAGTLLLFSFVCLKSQESFFKLTQVVLGMLHEWCLDVKKALTMFVIVSLTLFSLHVFYGKLYHKKKKVTQFCVHVLILNIATALIHQMINEEKYLNLFNAEKALIFTLMWIGDAIGLICCIKTSPYISAIFVCFSLFCCHILQIVENNSHHYIIVLVAFISSAMLEYTAMMTIGRSLLKVYDIPFYIRRGIGFVLGVAMVYFMNWTFAFFSGEFISDQMLSVSIVLSFELWGFCQVKQAMKKGMDVTKIRSAKLKYENGVLGMHIKFVLIDCGGQEEYHYFHHLFIPKDAVYIIVFNFEEAKGHKDANELHKQFKKLRYWLKCVLAHICLPPDDNYRPVFIVGTHRDSVDEEDRQQISQELTVLIKKEDMDKNIFWNKDTLIFEVENSGQCKKDEGGKHLRKQVAGIAVLKRQETEIKWLGFSKIMPELPPIIMRSKLKEAVIKRSVVKGDSEFQKFVKYFNERGDIHYCNGEAQFVVLRHGQSSFVNLFLEILNMTERKEKKKGILHKDNMVQAIQCKIKTLSDCKSMTHEEIDNLKYVCQKLMEENYLIVQIPGSPYYLVPFQLKNASQEDRDNLWNMSQDKEITFGLDFENFEPKPIFWRLTSTLLKMSGDKNYTVKNFRQTVYSDFAVFTEPSTGIKHKLEMKSIISQNVILFTTSADPDLPAGAIEQQTYEVFANLHKQLNDICKSSFPGQKYSAGLVCKIRDEHTCLWDEKDHVHMYHLGDHIDLIPNGIFVDCDCGAAPKMKIYVQPERKEREREFRNLKSNWRRFENGLNPSPVLPYLLEKNVLDTEDMKAIRNARDISLKEGCTELLLRVCKCPLDREPIRHFRSILRDKNYSDLADMLEPSPETADDTMVKQNI